MNRNLLKSIVASLAISTATTIMAAELTYEDLQWGEYGELEASLTDVAGDAAEGAVIFGDKSRGNCVACHLVASHEATFPGTVGPELSGVGEYREAADLRGIVVDAKRTFEGSVMPSMFRTSGFTRPGDGFTGKKGTEPLPPLLTAQEIEDVVAYLLTLKEE